MFCNRHTHGFLLARTNIANSLRFLLAVSTAKLRRVYAGLAAHVVYYQECRLQTADVGTLTPPLCVLRSGVVVVLLLRLPACLQGVQPGRRGSVQALRAPI